MNQPTVSVVMPTYNASGYLTVAIQSVLSQTHPPEEIIVVDDGSGDGTATAVKQFGDQVRYIYQENGGPASARNRGLAEAQGEYVALLDGDDAWLPAFLQSMLALAQSQPQAAGYYCWAQCMAADGQLLPQLAGAQRYASDRLYESLLQANFLIPSAMILRRQAVLEAGGFDPDPALRGVEDWDMWLRLSRTQSIIGIPDVLIHYRLHENSLSANSLRMQQAAQTLITKHFGADDGSPDQWSSNKRRAYSGLYRFCALTTVLKRGDWSAAGLFLVKAARVNPAIYADLDLFYELALGSQPVGYRGTSEKLDLETNARQIVSMLDANISRANRLPYSTAFYTLGLVAYNTRHGRQSTGFLWQAARHRPGLWLQRKFLTIFIKSLVR